jgi:hypothetical protein
VLFLIFVRITRIWYKYSLIQNFRMPSTITLARSLYSMLKHSFFIETFWGLVFTHFRMVEVIFFSLICWWMFLFFVEFLNCFDHKLWWSLLLIIIIPRTRWKYSSVYSNGVEIKERLEVVKVSVFSMYNIVKEIP